MNIPPTLVTAPIAILAAGCLLAPAAAADVEYLLSDGESGVWTNRDRLGPAFVESYTDAADGGPTFNVEYLDVTNGTGVGFDDPAFGATRRDNARRRLRVPGERDH